MCITSVGTSIGFETSSICLGCHVVFDVTDVFRGGEMTDTPPSDGPSQGAEFDMMGALDWKDGIATLPGSEIRV